MIVLKQRILHSAMAKNIYSYGKDKSHAYEINIRIWHKAWKQDIPSNIYTMYKQMVKLWEKKKEIVDVHKCV